MWLVESTHELLSYLYSTLLFKLFLMNTEFVRKQDPHFVWTDGTSGEGGNFICNGFHFIDRLGYYVTEVPWEDGDNIEVILRTPEQDSIDFQQDSGQEE